jgi:hypothetical protein
LRADAGKVAVLGDTPFLSQDPIDCLAAPKAEASACAEPATTVLRDPEWRAIVRTEAQRAGVPVIDPVPWLCGARCPTVLGDLLVYRDTNHLTVEYAAMLAPLLSSELPTF